MKNKELSLKQNMIYNSVGKLFYLFFQWLTTIIIVWFSGYSDAGVLALAISVTSTLYSISNYGMRSYQSSDMSNKFSYTDYFNSRIITCVLSFIICILFVVFTSYSMYIKLCIVLYMIFKITDAVVDVLHGEEQKIWRMDIIGKSFLLRGFLMILSYGITLFYTKNLVYSLLVMDIFLTLSVIIYDFKQFKNLFGKFGSYCSSNVRKLLIICLPLAIYTLCSNAVMFFPKYFLEKTYGTEILGIYSSIASPLCIIQVSAAFIFDPLITLFAEYYRDGDLKSFFKLFWKVCLIILLIFVIGLICIKLFGNIALKILFGQDILDYSYLLYQILITTILTALVWFISVIVTVIRKLKLIVCVSIVSILLNAVLSCFIVPKYSLTGVTIVLVITLIFQILAEFVPCCISLKKKEVR